MTLHHGDCLEVMAAMEPESVDAIVTDPPYGLEFMGKEWDRLTAIPDRDQGPRGRNAFGGWHGSSGSDPRAMQEWHARWAEAAYRVAKPSAYLLAFGGTRTVHRMTVALEDAGWIIRDMLVWGYASGFPKSKASLKPAWEPIVMARKPGPLRMLNIDECRIPHETINGGNLADNPHLRDTKVRADPAVTAFGRAGQEVALTSSAGRWPANIVLTDPIFDGGVEGVVGGGETHARGNVTPTKGGSVAGYLGRERQGYFEGPIDPGDSGTYSRFFLIPKADRTDREPVLGGLPIQHAGVGIRGAEAGEYEDFVYPAPKGIGRWLREHREAAGLSAKAVCAAIGAHGAVNHGGAMSNWEQELNRPTPEQWLGLRDLLGFDDRYDEVMTTTRTVPRQLMEGKTARRANNHPTVKPTDLMRHLVRLVTPAGGVVLDPFLGSGTTALAAEMEGFEWIGIEREAEYVAIAEARLNGTQRGLGLDVGAPVPKMPNTHPDLSKHQPKVRNYEPHRWYAGDDQEAS